MIDAQVTRVAPHLSFIPARLYTIWAVSLSSRGGTHDRRKVQLPLARQAPRTRSDLGSRHRARPWASATAPDAIVVVVSEETGIISIAENGRLTRNISDSDLRNKLTLV